MNSENGKNNHNKTRASQNSINIIVDIILLLLLVAISSIGFIMKYIMPSGHAVRHEGAQPYASDVLGLDRHGWGDIHWVLSVFFLLFLILHIVLHWKMIIAMIKRMMPNNTVRRALWVLIAFITFSLLICPFLYML